MKINFAQSAVTLTCTAFLSLTCIAQEQQPADRILQLEQALQSLEARSGAFEAAIGETSLQLGRLYEEQSRHEEALDAYEQADQRLKITSGLYAPEREAILREIFQQHLRLSNWDQAESAAMTLAWVQARNLDSASGQYLPARTELARWYLASEFYDVADNPELQLRKAHEQLAEITTASDAPDQLADRDLIELYLATNYRIALYAPQDQANDLQMTLLTLERNLELEVSRAISACNSAFRDNPGRARACAQQQETLIRSRSPLNDPFFMNDVEEQLYGDRFAQDAERRGSNAARNWLDNARQSGDTRELVDALLLYADWNIALRRLSTAEDAYLEAWLLIKQEGLENDFNLDTPKPLYLWGMRDRLPNIPELSAPSAQFVELSFRVTEEGRAEDVNIVSKPDDSDAQLNRLARQFDTILFRPALNDGVPMQVRGVRMKLALPN